MRRELRRMADGAGVAAGVAEGPNTAPLHNYFADVPEHMRQLCTDTIMDQRQWQCLFARIDNLGATNNVTFIMVNEGKGKWDAPY